MIEIVGVRFKKAGKIFGKVKYGKLL